MMKMWWRTDVIWNCDDIGRLELKGTKLGWMNWDFNRNKGG